MPPRPRWLRGARHISGFFLIFTGIPLLVSPLPVAPAIFLGLNLLKDDYVWANRLLGRLRTTSAQLRSHFPQSRLRLAQAALRRQLFQKRNWWGRPTGPQAPPPPKQPPSPTAQS